MYVYMQGFCCGCTSGNIYDQTFGDGTQRTRAGIACNWRDYAFIPFFDNTPDSAHCLRMNNAWWEMHQIHEAHMDFELVITVNTTLATNTTGDSTNSTSNSSASVLTLGPSRPRGVTEDKRVSAHLLGELASYIQFPVLTSSKFLVRKAPGALWSLGPDDMLVVSDTMVTLDGTECNKVGVGFTAFKYVQNLPMSFSCHGCSMTSSMVDWFCNVVQQTSRCRQHTSWPSTVLSIKVSCVDSAVSARLPLYEQWFFVTGIRISSAAARSPHALTISLII